MGTVPVPYKPKEVHDTVVSAVKVSGESALLVVLQYLDTTFDIKFPSSALFLKGEHCPGESNTPASSGSSSEGRPSVSIARAAVQENQTLPPLLAPAVRVDLQSP